MVDKKDLVNMERRRRRYRRIAWNFFVLKLHGEVLVDGVLPEIEEMMEFGKELLSLYPKIKELGEDFIYSIVFNILEGIKDGKFLDKPCGLPGLVRQRIRGDRQVNKEILLEDY